MDAKNIGDQPWQRNSKWAVRYWWRNKIVNQEIILIDINFFNYAGVKTQDTCTSFRIGQNREGMLKISPHSYPRRQMKGDMPRQKRLKSPPLSAAEEAISALSSLQLLSTDESPREVTFTATVLKLQMPLIGARKWNLETCKPALFIWGIRGQIMANHLITFSCLLLRLFLISIIWVAT